jgi:hypothetical protein
MKQSILIVLAFFIFGVAAAQNEVSIPKKKTKPLSDKCGFVGEFNLLAIAPVAGDPALGLSVGIHIPKANISILASANTPGNLNNLGAKSIFDKGDRFDVYWNGEVNILFRYHLKMNAFAGWYVQGGIGYEGFELIEKDIPNGPTVTLNNGYLPIGAGYTSFLFGSKIYARAGVGAVFLFGNGGKKTIGSQTTQYNWGFITPEIRIGIRL